MHSSQNSPARRSLISKAAHAFVGLIVASLLVVFLAAPTQASNFTEIEPNNSTSTANLIKLGTTYSGSSLSADSNDYDHFAVDIPSNGRATVNLKFPANLGTSDAYRLRIYNAAGQELYSFNVPASANTGTWLASQGIYLPAGRAYIEIYAYSGRMTWGETYTLNVSHTPGNVETERNNSTSTANLIKLGTTYSGSSLSADSNDYDHFAVDIPSNGRATVNLKFPANLGTSDAYRLRIYNAAGQELYSFNVPASANTGTWLASQGIYLPAGRAYIEIYAYSGRMTWGETYTLNVSHTPGNVETERNNSTSTANLIKLGTTYSGSSLSADSNDYDHFAVDIPSNGRATVNLKFPANLGTSDAYRLRIYNAAGQELYSFNVPASANTGTWLASQGIYLPAGRAYIEIYAYSGRMTWGETYTLNVSHTPGNVETERNNSTSTANLIKLGTTYSGSSLSADSNDYDHFAVDMLAQGRVTVSLKYPIAETGESSYDVVIYNASGIELYNYRLDPSDANGVALSKLPISLDKGRSYIRIYSYNGRHTWGDTYNLNVTALLTGTPVPTISGTTKVGYTLTAKPGTWTPASVALKYQWKRNGVSITGATAATYRLTTSDAGKSITVTVTGSKTGYKTVTKTSAGKAIPLIALTATPVPTISGTAKVGNTLTAKPGTWTPATVAFKYQWKRNGVSITGATAATYKLTTSDAGKSITVTVTGSKTGYKTVTKTSAGKTIPLLALTATPVPTISGTAKVGNTLTAKPGTWAPKTVTLRYQWKRNGVSITGATAATYKLTTKDAGKSISVAVTGSKTGYKTVTKASAGKAINR